MKSRFILITAILATGVGFGVSSNSVASPPEAQASAQLGDHPAVVVARMQAKRGIDPNTFIVAHPAGVRQLAASPTATASTATASAGR
ncbi:hypothetical protein ACFPN2_37080 [Steroidobacter flavus]|uniref:Uncharacterized protein n=1 Tax=Steroidobacter flavus TaxID=1842136 RepID=A0ABV8T710_9GAMM